MRSVATGLISGLVLFGAGSAVQADSDRWSFDSVGHRSFGYLDFWDFDKYEYRGIGTQSFQRIATLPNYLNRSDSTDATVSEIVAATKDGKVLAYTDASTGSLGFVSIHVPQYPMPFGTVDLGGDPTSVDILGNRYALVGVNTGSLAEPSGHLAVVNIRTRAIEAQLDLGGQPDSVKISPDGRYVAVAIENERDEEVEVDGVEGALPQAPAGFLAIVDIIGWNPSNWSIRSVDLSGLSDYAPSDPEPEFVDVNDNNEAVVTLQENNHVVIVDLKKGEVIGDFSAGTVDLDGIDVDNDFVITPTEALFDVPREPDAVAWIPLAGGNYRIATANEGDLFGGSRGFSVFNRDGTLLYDAGNDFELLAMRHGHYPEDRSDNKGTEPEAITFARYGRDKYLFVGSERGSFMAVYDVNGYGQPRFKQLLPAPLGPEGVLAIPEQNLLVIAGEEDDPTYGVRSTMMIYRLDYGRPDYPQIVSENGPNGLPIPWSALSGLVATGRDELLAVWDSYYSESRIFRIDVRKHPAKITESILISGGTSQYDPEGIAIAPDGTLWIASEGSATDSRQNLLLHTDTNGHVLHEIGLPEDVLACREAERQLGEDANGDPIGKIGTHGSGFEGVAVVKHGNAYKLAVAQQRGWDYTTAACEDLDDDALGLNARGEPNATRIWLYDPTSGDWDHIAWELAPLPADASWVGLSEITAGPWGTYVVLERDNRTGDWSDLKTLVKVEVSGAADGLIDAGDKAVYDLIPALESTHGWISDKPEGVAITPRGDVYVVTDNDGVDGWSGETTFLDLGNFYRLFWSWRR